MANLIQLRRSATANAVPTTTQLALGELAINTYDGRLYLKKNVSGTESIIEIGSATSADFTAGGALVSANSTGDEGGEIRLAKAVTNTTLTTSITVDIYQNKFRIFETGGTNRGVYIDLSAAAAGVATNLLGGSMTYPAAGIAVSTGTAWTTSLTAPSGTIVGTSDTQTLTNKRINSRITSITSASTITPTADASDVYIISALAVAATIAAPSGTPVDGQKLIIRFEDNGTAQTLTWTTSSGGYRAIGLTLPTTTTATKTLYVGCMYNAADGFWDVIAKGEQA